MIQNMYCVTSEETPAWSYQVINMIILHNTLGEEKKRLHRIKK